MDSESKDVVNIKKLIGTDASSSRNEYIFEIPRFLDDYFMSKLNDKRDIVLVRTMANITFTTVFFAFLLFLMKSVPIWIGIAYTVFNVAVWYERFFLTLHFSSHKKMFPKGDILNKYGGFFLAPFFGLPSGVYYFHHVVMHHIENNVFPYDVSSTMTYQRNSFIHFLHYWFRYAFAIWFQLPYYLYIRKRHTYLVQLVMGILGFFFLIAVSWRINSSATTWVFIMPWLVSSFLLMFGNWSQHIFVDPNRYKDSYALTYNIINTPMNKRTFNDGYHIVHHLHSTLHWSELPDYFVNNVSKFVDNECFTFQNIDYFMIGVLVMTGQYRTLAKHYVNIDGKVKTEEEIIKKMHKWFEPVVLPQ